MAPRLIRSSSMGQSADLLRPFSRDINTVPRVSDKQKTERNLDPAKKVVAAQIAKQEPPTVVAEKPRKCIFTLASPPRVEKQRTDYFLDACALCKKKIEPRKCIFTLASPPRVEKQRTDYFLDACALCKKKIDLKEDIFMYGDFQAFCSPECRDDQIALDGKFSPLSRDRNQQSRFIRTHNGHWKTGFNF